MNDQDDDFAARHATRRAVERAARDREELTHSVDARIAVAAKYIITFIDHLPESTWNDLVAAKENRKGQPVTDDDEVQAVIAAMLAANSSTEEEVRQECEERGTTLDRAAADWIEQVRTYADEHHLPFAEAAPEFFEELRVAEEKVEEATQRRMSEQETIATWLLAAGFRTWKETEEYLELFDEPDEMEQIIERVLADYQIGTLVGHEVLVTVDRTSDEWYRGVTWALATEALHFAEDHQHLPPVNARTAAHKARAMRQAEEMQAMLNSDLSGAERLARVVEILGRRD